MKPQSFIFIGRSGAGKGTQAELLMKSLKEKDPKRNSLYITTGGELRELAKMALRTGQVIKNVLENGGLMPSFIPIYIWTKVMSERYTGNEHLVFDGTPRKPMEAQALDDLFPFYGLGKPYIIYLDVDHEESTKRLSTRGRYDDSPEAIKQRFAWYESEVLPTIDYYRSNPNCIFLDVDGERSIEEIHADIVKRVGLQ